MAAVSAWWAVQLYTVDWVQALVLLGTGVFTLAVVLPGVDGMARGNARDLGVPAVGDGGRRALVMLFALVGLALLTGGVITVIAGLVA